jgi:hypothetical protein
LPRESIAGVTLRDNYGEMAYNIPVLLLKIKGMGDPHGHMAWLTHEPEEWEKIISSMIG